MPCPEREQRFKDEPSPPPQIARYSSKIQHWIQDTDAAGFPPFLFYHTGVGRYPVHAVDSLRPLQLLEDMDKSSKECRHQHTVSFLSSLEFYGQK
jgi:ribosomal protein S12 methylthiotransferase accessory factor YcaO